jgi:hypothetical protein
VCDDDYIPPESGEILRSVPGSDTEIALAGGKRSKEEPGFPAIVTSLSKNYLVV